VLRLGQSALSLQDLVLAVIMVALAFWVGGWSQQVSYNLALTRVRDLGIRQSLSTFVQYVVIVLGLLLTLKIIGLDLTALTVFAASVGVGIGFGLQNVVNNFISGVLLLAERPLRVTDVVTIGSETGEVTRIGIRSLTVRMFDRKELIIPNSAVIGNTFTNWTRTDDVLREVLMFRVSFRDDPRAAAAQIEAVARSVAGVVANPPPKATVYEFTDAAITVRLQYYARLRGPVGGLDIRADILSGVRDAFADAGFSVPTPSGEVVLLRSMPAPPREAAAALAAPG
jgi:potassium efflux system protein